MKKALSHTIQRLILIEWLATIDDDVDQDA
jgi:hypothetical protein